MESISTVGPPDDPRGALARGIDLRQLAYFKAVAEELHFGRAARRLHLSQPPLSIQVRALEARLGVPLLERNRVRVALTPAGEVLARELDGFFERLTELLGRVQAAGRGESGTLRLGFVTPAEYGFLPDRVREFRAAAPDVALSLREMTSDAQFAALADGALDAGFVLPPLPAGHALAYRMLVREPLVLALPAQHRLARQRAPSLATVAAKLPLVIFPRDKAPGLHDEILGLFAAAGVIPMIGQEAIQMQTIVSLVAAGLGAALVPASLRNLRRKGVAYRMAPAGPQVEIGLAWRVADTSPVLVRFIEHCVEQAS